MAISQDQSGFRVWNGERLPDGARIALRASGFLFGDGIRGWADHFGSSAGMMLQSHRFTPSEDYYDYLVVSEGFSGVGTILTVETWPTAEGERFSWSNYTKCVLRGENGKYLESNCAGALRASAEKDAARVFYIAMAYDKPTIFEGGYLYAERDRMDPQIGNFQKDGAYTLMPYGAPPYVPLILHIHQGYLNALTIIWDASDASSGT